MTSETRGLLNDVIRSLKSTASADQRELAAQRLEKSYRASGQHIDQLLTQHEDDVKKSISAFRDVSRNVRECREKINSVQNSLQASKSLLQSRRDELKKLWTENLKQKMMTENFQRIAEVKNLERRVDELASAHKFNDAVQLLKKAETMLNGPLSAIEGLNQLKTKVYESSQNVLAQIVHQLLEWLIVEPFDKQMLEIARSLSETAASESVICMRLLEKYQPGKPVAAALGGLSIMLANQNTSQLNAKLIDVVDALMVFDQLETALDQFTQRTPVLCKAAVNDTVALLAMLPDNSIGDAQPLVQLIQILFVQIRSSHAGHKQLADRLRKVLRADSDEIADNLLKRFWNCAQDIVQSVASDHLDISIADAAEKSAANAAEYAAKGKSLFRFSRTASVATSVTAKSEQPLALICQPNPENITKIFHLLNRFCAEIEATNIVRNPCKLNTFLHTFIMETFIERVRNDLDKKVDLALSGTEVWSTLANVPGHNVRILSSCIRVLELCQQIGSLIKSMETYAQRFASLWLLIMEEYTRNATAKYLSGEKMTEHSKISATWAVDEDISRLLKTLPSWTAISQTPAADITPTAALLNLNESDSEIRQRTQRESEILISNLGAQRQIDRFAMITDMEHARAIVCMHESLKWFCMSMQRLMADIPKRAREAMKCVVRIESVDGEKTDQVLSEALISRLGSLESMSETCLLMMHLELRVHCFFHLLPLARGRGGNNAPATNHLAEVDPEITEFGRDIRQYHQLLSQHLPSNKVKYLFEGLGHLCASIFIASSQHMTKLSESARKRVCRNIFTVQRDLSQLCGRPETELNRAQTFFDLLNREPDDLLALIMERGANFTPIEYTYLLSLAVRSHPVLSAQPGALEAKLKQLQEILRKINQ